MTIQYISLLVAVVGVLVIAKSHYKTNKMFYIGSVLWLCGVTTLLVHGAWYMYNNTFGG